jgi:hypothetical protein
MRRLRYRVSHKRRTDTLPPRVSTHIVGNFCCSQKGLASRAVRTQGTPAPYRTVDVGYVDRKYRRIVVTKPIESLISSHRAKIRRRKALFHGLVVDGNDCRKIVQGRKTDHDGVEYSSNTTPTGLLRPQADSGAVHIRGTRAGCPSDFAKQRQIVRLVLTSRQGWGDSAPPVASRTMGQGLAPYGFTMCCQLRSFSRQ